MNHRSPFLGPLCAGLLVIVPATAEAVEVNGGVSMGGIQIGTEPSLAMSAFVGLLWRKEQGFLLELHNMFSVIPGANIGVYDRTSVTLGYSLKTVDVSVGPSLSIYSMLVCGIVICNRVVGVAPGGHAKTDWYFADPWGASVSANLDWAGGSSRVLSGSWVVMVTAGPILRLRVGSK